MRLKNDNEIKTRQRSFTIDIPIDEYCYDCKGVEQRSEGVFCKYYSIPLQESNKLYKPKNACKCAEFKAYKKCYYCSIDLFDDATEEEKQTKQQLDIFTALALFFIRDMGGK